jgi:hypothetical protein
MNPKENNDSYTTAFWWSISKEDLIRNLNVDSVSWLLREHVKKNRSAFVLVLWRDER